MPARKPAGLIRRAETKEKKAQRAEGEESLRPRRELPLSAPARLDGHTIAASAWRRIMRSYSELEAEVVTRLDLDLLLDYCILLEQLTELDTMRKKSYLAWLDISEAHTQAKGEGRHDDAVLLAIKVVGAFDAVVKLDGRADRKRDLLLKWRQSLYLTPRARAGATPAKKEPEPEKDDLELLLDEFAGYVNQGDAK
jgi:phage terminase small subunit